MARKSNGRKKVEMVKMTNENNLSVTFSKRRNGVFKKASEISTLCGVEVAVVVFSPAQKAFSFGHPSVENVTERYLADHYRYQYQTPEPTEVSQRLEAMRNANVRELNMHLTELLSQVEFQRKRGVELDRRMRVSREREQRWWEFPIEELNFSQLQQLKSAMEELKKKVALQVQAEKLLMESANPLQFFIGSSSSQGVIPNHEGIYMNDMPLSDPNLMGQGYAAPAGFSPTITGEGFVIPNTIAPPPAHNPDQEYGIQDLIAAPLPVSVPVPPPPYDPSMLNEGYNVVSNMNTAAPGNNIENPQGYSIHGHPGSGPGFF